MTLTRFLITLASVFIIQRKTFTFNISMGVRSVVWREENYLLIVSCWERNIRPGPAWVADHQLAPLSPQGPYPVPPAPASHQSQSLLGLLPSSPTPHLHPSQTITIPLHITTSLAPGCLTSPPSHQPPTIIYPAWDHSPGLSSSIISRPVLVCPDPDSL